MPIGAIMPPPICIPMGAVKPLIDDDGSAAICWHCMAWAISLIFWPRHANFVRIRTA